MNKTIIAIIISISLIVFGIIITSDKNQRNNDGKKDEIINNVSIVEGKQIIEIMAKGGYIPRKSVAQSGIPTILKINTNGTFDCSSSIRIPSMNIYKNLPQTGITEIDLGTNNKGVLKGSCGMGMYPFQIEFQ